MDICNAAYLLIALYSATIYSLIHDHWQASLGCSQVRFLRCQPESFNSTIKGREGVLIKNMELIQFFQKGNLIAEVSVPILVKTILQQTDITLLGKSGTMSSKTEKGTLPNEV